MRTLLVFIFAAMGYAFSYALLTVGICIFLPNHECYFNVALMHYLFAAVAAAGVITALASEIVLRFTFRSRNRYRIATVLVYGFLGPLAYSTMIILQIGMESLSATEMAPWVLSGMVEGILIGATCRRRTTRKSQDIGIAAS